MRIVIAAVGVPRHRHLAAAIADYESRAARYWPLDVVEVREARGGAAATAGAEARRREGERLLARIPGGTQVIACDEGGEALTSARFARLIVDLRDRAQSVAFLLGGAFGLADSVRRRAGRCLQLAPFTLPHELARLVLAEQLYRAGTIAHGQPYHK